MPGQVDTGVAVAASGKVLRPLRRRRRWLRRLSWTILSLLVLTCAALAAAYFYISDPQRLTQRLQSVLRDQLGADVTLGGALLEWPGSLEVRDLALRPGRPLASSVTEAVAPIQGQEPAVLTFSQARLVLDPLALLTGRLEVSSIDVVEPSVRVDESCVHSIRNWFAVLSSKRGDAPPPRHWPRLHIQRATVTLASHDSTGAPAEELVNLDIRGRVRDGDDDAYVLTWQVDGDEEAAGELVLDVPTGRLRTLRGTTPWLSAGCVASTLDAFGLAAGRQRNLETWRRKLGLEGRLRLCDGVCAWNDGGVAEPAGQIQFEFDSLSIPVAPADFDAPPEARYARFSSVIGSAAVQGRRVSAEVDARFQDAACRLNALAVLPGSWGNPAAAELDVRGSVSDLTLPRAGVQAPPAQAAFIEGIPPLARFYRRYAPAGTVNVEFVVMKGAGADAPLQAPYVKLTALDCRAAYEKFLYEGRHVSGVIEYTPLGIFVHELRGEHAGGTIIVNAWTPEPTGPATTRVSIEGRNIALDDDLQQALPPGFRKVWDQFAPRGSADIQVHIERPGEGLPRPNAWSNHIAARLHNASLEYRAFPYRIHGLEGAVTITDHTFDIDNLTGRHGAAEVGINGFVEHKDGRLTQLDIHVEARAAAVDDDLFAALPAPVREVVTGMSPEGDFDASAAIYLGPDHSPAYDIDVFPRALSVRPQPAPLRVQDVTGRIRFADQRIELDQVAGTHENATLCISGSYPLDRKPTGPDLRLQCHGLRLTDEVCSALPRTVRDALAPWRLQGPLRLDSHIQPDAANPSGIRYQHVLILSDGTVRHRDWPAALEHVDAALTLDTDGVKGLRLSALWNGAGVGMDVHRHSVDPSARRYTATGHLDNLRLDDRLRDMLPRAQQTLFHSLRPSGAVNVRLDTLEIEHRRDEKAVSFSLAGRAVLENLDAPGAAQLAGADGTLTFSGDVNVPKGYVSLNGLVLLDRAGLLGKHVTALTGDWTFRSAPQGWSRFTVEDVEATAYGGSATGEVVVNARPQGTEFEVSASVAGLDLGEYLKDSPSAKAMTPELDEVCGRVDGSLTLSGRVGGTLSRTGDGRVAIREARLYRLPIMLAILRVINLAESSEGAAQDARATFSINGERLTFHDLYVRDPAVALVGEGSCFLPDTSVNLRLIAVSPHDWARVPVLSELLEGASRELMELEITGPVGKPVVRPGPLRGLKSMWQTLFPEKPERRGR